jgi:hypothetical protein
VLPGPSLGNDATFTHTSRKQRLAECVVDLVRACMQKVFAL